MDLLLQRTSLFPPGSAEMWSWAHNDGITTLASPKRLSWKLPQGGGVWLQNTHCFLMQGTRVPSVFGLDSPPTVSSDTRDFSVHDLTDLSDGKLRTPSSWQAAPPAVPAGNPAQPEINLANCSCFIHRKQQQNTGGAP